MTSQLLQSLINCVVVVDFRSTYVCLGTLTGLDEHYLEIRNADLHDLRDSKATRENYTYDSKQFGIRRNREVLLINRDEVVAISPLDAIMEV